MDILKLVGQSIKSQVDGVSGSDSALSHVLRIVSGLLVLIGIVTVGFIIKGGIDYAMSQGDPGKVKKAKDSILYAVIGLVVSVLAFAIVQFILNHVKV